MFDGFAHVWTPLIETRRVKDKPLRIVLAGGHCYETTCKPDSSLLQRIAAMPGLSPDVTEVVTRTLAD